MAGRAAVSFGGSTAEALHLAKRFFGAVRPGAPDLADERWALDHLLQGEAEIWCRMNNPDRRHAVGVARAVEASLRTANPDAEVDRPVVAAALLHDSGKVVSRLRTPARVVATVLWAVTDDRLADRWITGRPTKVRTRLAQYRRHPALGAALLQDAGSAELTHRWAAQHHEPESTWTVPLGLGRVLKACDDD